MFGDGTKPLVAIVTPTHNSEKFIRQTLDCVQRQIYPHIVHVVFDNSSTDSTRDIIQSFIGQRIPVLFRKSDDFLELSDSWNRAFSYLPQNARYAKLLCADDLIRPDTIERFVDISEKNPSVQVVLSEVVSGNRSYHSRLPTNQTVYNGKEFTRSLLQNSIRWIAYHHFFVRILSDFRGSNFIPDYWSPDPHVVLRSAVKGDVAYIHEPMIYNRIHVDSVTRKETESRGIEFQIVQMYLLLEFARVAFSDVPNSDKKVRELYSNFVKRSCQYIIRWSLSGQRKRAFKLRDILESHGFKLGIKDYIRSLVAWPLRRFQSELREVAAGPFIDEFSFLNSARDTRV